MNEAEDLLVWNEDEHEGQRSTAWINVLACRDASDSSSDIRQELTQGRVSLLAVIKVYVAYVTREREFHVHVEGAAFREKEGKVRSSCPPLQSGCYVGSSNPP